MVAFILRRSAYTVVLLFVISLVIFVITSLLPGDVATMTLGTGATPEAVEALREQLGLNRSASERYLGWLGGILTGDLGESVRMLEPIGPILASRLATSLSLAGMAFAMIVVGGIVLGVVTGLYKGSRFDKIASTLSVMGTSLPEFVTGTLLVIVFAGGVWNVFPPSGYVELSEGFFAWARHLILPALTLAVILTAYVARMARSSVISVERSDYVRTARLKGLKGWTVVTRHILRNALLPTVTVLFMNLGWIFGGIVVVEEVFVIPGIGRLMLSAITDRDWPLIQACALVIAAIYVLGNFIADLLQLFLDPRIREEQLG